MEPRTLLDTHAMRLIGFFERLVSRISQWKHLMLFQGGCGRGLLFIAARQGLHAPVSPK